MQFRIGICFATALFAIAGMACSAVGTAGATSVETKQTFPSLGVTIDNESFKLNQSTLADIGSKYLLRVLRVESPPDSGYSTCLSIMKGTSIQRIRFLSDSEMGGSDRQLTRIEGTSVSSKLVDTKECPIVSTAKSSGSIDHGIWLEMSSNEVASVLGVDSLDDGDHVFTDASKIRSSDLKAIELDVVSTVTLTLHRGRVSAITMNQIVSN